MSPTHRTSNDSLSPRRHIVVRALRACIRSTLEPATLYQILSTYSQVILAPCYGILKQPQSRSKLGTSTKHTVLGTHRHNHKFPQTSPAIEHACSTSLLTALHEHASPVK